MNENSVKHVAALVETALAASAAGVRASGESAFARPTELSDREFLVSLEVDRERGDWQRNLGVVIQAAGAVWSVEARITDDERLFIIEIGRVEVAHEVLVDVALALAPAGAARLGSELLSAASAA